MKKKNKKIKKGMTLIEVIISVTLLSILIVPISGFILSSLKNNTTSQKKQEASYIGQKILEELKAYEYISLETDENGKYFQLLDGDKIYKDLNSNSFNGNFKRNIYGKVLENDDRNLREYNVELSMVEDSNFKFNDINNLDMNSDADFKIDFINDGKLILTNSETKEEKQSSENIVIKIEKEDNEFNLSIYDKNNTEIGSAKKENKNNKILLYISSGYNINTNIEIENYTGEWIYVYLIKQKNNPSDINIISTEGRVVLSEEEEISLNEIGTMYQYTIEVKDSKDNILFQGQSSNNININIK